MQAQRHLVAHIDLTVFLRDEQRGRLFTGNSKRDFHDAFIL
jgi:hypothetical protein